MSGFIKQVLSGGALVVCLTSSTLAFSQIAKDKCKFLGNIVEGAAPFDFTQYWNQVTPENSGKWGSVESTRDVMSWTGLDNAYNFAKNNNFPFKQHTFVWGQQQPGWISALSQAEQKEEVEEWIKTFCERYPETDFIDVVNEPLHVAPDYMAALGGGGTTGWDWVIWSFEKARQYCPNAKLVLNDYNIISSAAATASYLAIIGLLKQRNLIDIIGEQGHFLETTPVNTLKSNLDKLHAVGLPIHISEFDVNLLDDNAQRDKYAELFPVLWTHPGVQGITLWGYRQGKTWREDAYLMWQDGRQRPAFTWLSSYVPTVSGGSFCLPVANSEEIFPRIEVYPNPALNGTFTITFTAGSFDIKVLDLHGKVNKDLGIIQPGTTHVQLHAAPGLYMLQISNEQRKVFKKIFIH